MADISVFTPRGTATNVFVGRLDTFWTDVDTGYIIGYYDTNNDIECFKTTDAGSTWALVDEAGFPTLNGDNLRGFSVYPEQRNGSPNDVDLIHVAFSDNITKDLRWTTFDTSTDTWDSTGATVLNTAVTVTTIPHTLAVNTAGKILIPYNLDSGTTVGAMYWNGSTWAEKGGASSNPWVATPGSDVPLVEVANGGVDFICAVFDRTASVLSIVGYRTAADDWTAADTSISLTMGSNRYAAEFDMKYDPVNDEVLLAVQNNNFQATGDVDVYQITWDGTDVAPTVTGPSTVLANTAGSMVALTIDEGNSEVYCAYTRGATNVQDVY